MRTRNSTDEMSSGEKFDAVQYVKDNYDDYEDGWGLNLMNLKEVTGQEMTDENMKEILPKLLREVENEKNRVENRKRLMQTNDDEKRNKEDKEQCHEEMNKKNSLSPITGFYLLSFPL